MKMLVTGGAGFIGSTIASACLDAGHHVVILDNLSKGRVEYVKDRRFYRGSIGDSSLIRRIFDENPDIDVTIHCAARIVVPESVADPAAYYENNIGQGLTLLRSIEDVGCQNVIFSSSASVYASHPGFSVDEESRLVAASPYARTKLMFEWILQDLAATGRMNVVSLRYFNPVGCDPLMRTGLQDPTPTHALGKLIEAFQKREPFMVTGVDWPTPDGTAIRDYIHVWDLARAHVAAADWLLETREPCEVINLGTGRGTSVRELVDAFGSVVGRPIEIVEVDRRPGDVVGCYTKSDKARRLLGWEAEKTLTEGIRDSLAWTRYRDEVLGDPHLTIDLDEGWADVETDMNVALR